jgi:hypothetical protein
LVRLRASTMIGLEHEHASDTICCCDGAPGVPSAAVLGKRVASPRRSAATASGWCAGACTATTRWKGRLPQLKDVCRKSSEENVVSPATSRRWHSPPSP